MYGLTNDDVNSITSILVKYPEVQQAVIFGSRAKGNFKNGSDVDISLKGTYISHSIINAISFELNEETMMPYQFDILDYRAIQNTSLTQHIDSVGKILYQKPV